MGYIAHLRKSFDESNVEIKKRDRQTEMKTDRKRNEIERGRDKTHV